MNFSTIKDVVTSKTARSIFQLKRNSPTILFIGGAAGVITATVLACKATLKLEKVVVEYETDKETIADKYQIDEDARNAGIRKLQVRMLAETAKLYLPALGVGVVSIGALAGGQIILTKRNGALMSAYVTLDQLHQKYRETVAEKIGKDAETELAAGVKSEVVEEQMANGKTKTTTKDTLKAGNEKSPYIHVFDQRSRLFSKEPGRNNEILVVQQNRANDRLRADGYLFLKDVLEMLGLPITSASALLGWRHKAEYGNSKFPIGDGYVDFGIYNNPNREWVDDFVNGKEYIAVMDFNCDGVIYDKI